MSHRSIKHCTPTSKCFVKHYCPIWVDLLSLVGAVGTLLTFSINPSEILKILVLLVILFSGATLTAKYLKYQRQKLQLTLPPYEYLFVLNHTRIHHYLCLSFCFFLLVFLQFPSFLPFCIPVSFSCILFFSFISVSKFPFFSFLDRKGVPEWCKLNVALL